MFLQLCAEIECCQRSRALQKNWRKKENKELRRNIYQNFKENVLSSCKGTKLLCNRSTRWNIKSQYLLANNVWPCFWAAELWVESKWLFCCQNLCRRWLQSEAAKNIRTGKTSGCISCCHLANAKFTSVQTHKEKGNKLLITICSQWEFIQQL